MHIVPVIDLLNGQVVHARAGRRDEYQPLQTRLAKSCRPEDVLEGLLAEYGFGSVYIADLNAITDGSCQIVELNRLREEFSDIEIWLDAGTRTIDVCENLDRVRPVFGSETGF
ncbi:MAG: HisA/HisF-related TIM barrel protein, partial [Gammaproteobacteria bacterium]|nr:HisA/HisF-related TIM barrel protein [Gammaproteobacteria bacterium]